MKIENYPKEYSDHARHIMKAVDRGYTFDFSDCALVTPRGSRIYAKLYGKQRYPCTTINNGEGTKTNISFALHKFAAYVLYGELALRQGVNVRHLDGNVLNLSKQNLVLGTSQDNQFDKAGHIRSSAAKKARASQGKRPVTSKVTDDEARQILQDYLTMKGNLLRAKNGTICRLAEKYGHSKTCIQAICNGHSFPDIYKEVTKYG